MHWEAHGHCYALSRAIDDDIRAGHTVVANVSRTVIEAMRQRLCQCPGGFDHGAAEVLASGWRCGAAAATDRSRTGCVAPWTMRRPRLMSTIVNISSAEYHARQLVADHQG